MCLQYKLISNREPWWITMSDGSPCGTECSNGPHFTSLSSLCLRSWSQTRAQMYAIQAGHKLKPKCMQSKLATNSSPNVCNAIQAGDKLRPKCVQSKLVTHSCPNVCNQSWSPNSSTKCITTGHKLKPQCITMSGKVLSWTTFWWSWSFPSITRAARQRLEPRWIDGTELCKWDLGKCNWHIDRFQPHVNLLPSLIAPILSTFKASSRVVFPSKCVPKLCARLLINCTQYSAEVHWPLLKTSRRSSTPTTAQTS